MKSTPRLPTNCATQLVKGWLRSPSQDAVLEVEQIVGIGSGKRVRLEQIPINDITVAVVSASPVYPRPDFPGPRAGEPQIVGEIIQVLVVDRIGDRRRQHAIGPLSSAEDSPTVPPALDRLKGLVPVNHHVGATPAEPLSENGHCEEHGTELASRDVRTNQKQEALDFHLTDRWHECWRMCNEVAASTSKWIFTS